MTRPAKLALVAFVLLLGGAGALSFRGMSSLPPAAASPAAAQDGALPVLADAMPPFAGISRWWNTADGKPLTPEALRGKVVLVDFWTYSCINCLRTLPFVKGLSAAYADKGLVVVGVHTPEFEFEGKADNVAREIAKLGIAYPVALDDQYGTWQAYRNQYWPAEYLFDAQGRLRHVKFGEGEYDQTEAAVRSLLAEAGATDVKAADAKAVTPDFSLIGTGETYFGLARGDAFAGTPGPAGKTVTYAAGASVASNKWDASGSWRFEPQYAVAAQKDDVFRFNVEASELHLVLASDDGTDKTIEVRIDGGAPQAMTVNAATLYTVARFPGGGRHTVEIRVRTAGVRFYSATFS